MISSLEAAGGTAHGQTQSNGNRSSWLNINNGEVIYLFIYLIICACVTSDS